MANLKDLIVQGAARIVGIIQAKKFVTDGGTATQFVKGDGSLDGNSYALASSVTDTATTQTNTTGNAAYRVLLSNNANDTTETGGTRKNTGLQYNPSTSALTVSKKVTTVAFNNKITGTGTVGYSGTTQTPNYMPSKWIFNIGVATPADGDRFSIKIPVAGFNTGVYLSLNNGTNYYPIVINDTSRLTTHYTSGTTVEVIYESGGTAASIWPVTGGTSGSSGTSAAGVFRIANYRDSNTTYSTMSAAELSAGTATSSRVMRADYMKTGLDKLYVPTGRTVTTASGLTGGGNLSANRTIGLAATGTAGTYYAVVTDAYGRVTSGSTQAPASGPWVDGTGTSSAILSGSSSTASGNYSVAEGSGTLAQNVSEHASGQFNISSSGSSTFGHSGNTLFSIGNGTSASAKSNAFEVRQNGDIYVIYDGETILLQDLITKVKTMEEVMSAALNDLNQRLVNSGL